MKIGNKQNAILNREYAFHVRRWYKKFTSRKRRALSKKIIKMSIKESCLREKSIQF